MRGLRKKFRAAGFPVMGNGGGGKGNVVTVEEKIGILPTRSGEVGGT